MLNSKRFNDRLSQPSTWKILAIAAMILSLSACQGTMRQIQDCKQGDWNVIGDKDGEKGLPANYEERRSFCSHVDSDKIKAESAAMYQAGWLRGNANFWSQLGNADGLVPRPVTFFAEQQQSKQVRENKTPINQAAYEQGWALGNAAYWRNLGDQDGVAGQASGIEKQRAANAGVIRFNQTSYQEGWRNGNQAYWTRLGFQDAHDGVADSALAQHTKNANAIDLLVRADAYQAAWNTEIIEYWKRTAWTDATNGWDVYMRRVDAKKRALKFDEVAYQTMWEQRLVQYWSDAGKDDGFGKPNRLDERIANARNDKVFVIAQTKETYLQSWSAENARYCSPENAFTFGRQSAYFEINVCHPTIRGRSAHAYENGQKYQVLSRELERVDRDIRYALDSRNDAEYRLNRLEKDIKKDQENKDRPKNADNDAKDKKRDQERNELMRSIHEFNRRLDELEGWRHSYRNRMEDLQRGI